MGWKNPAHPAFACRFDAGDYFIVLGRGGAPEGSLEVRLELKPATETRAIFSGFLVYIEPGECFSAVAGRIVDHLRIVAARLPDAGVIDAFQHVATNWLISNFRPALDPPQ